MSLNPLLWLHLRITGSTKTNIVIVAAYAAMVVVFASISFYVTAVNARPTERAGDLAQLNAIWLTIMTAAQAFFLLLLAPAAVRRAVMRDCESGMMESHRISPMSNLKVMLGYMSGAPVQALLLYLVSLVLGTYFATSYASSPGLGGAIGVRATLAGWYFAQGCMIMLAAMITSVVLLTALATRGKANVVGIFVLVGIFGGWFAIAFIPGLALLLGVLSGGVLVKLVTSARVGGDPLIIANAAALQFVFCLIFIAAACRKFRSPQHSLFSLPLSLVLLGVWGLTLVVGMRVAPEYPWLFSEWEGYGFAQLVASTIAFIVVSLFALTAASVNLHRRDRAAVFGQAGAAAASLALRLMPVLLAAATVLCLLLMYVNADRGQLSESARHAFESGATWLAIATAMLLSFWTDFKIMYFLAARTRRFVILLLIALLAIKGIPLLLDGIIWVVLEEIARRPWYGEGYLTGCSPIGTLILLPQDGVPLWVGLAVQALLATGATAIGRRVRRPGPDELARTEG